MGALIFSGASLTFLATAVDPFAQQILSFPSRQVQAFNETAFIQSARNYTINGESDEARIYDLQEKAITSGLSVPETGLQAQCTIEKCSYPRFVSLGICSKCEDVTERTTQECVGTVLPGVNGPLMDMNCTYTAPYEYTVTLSLKDLTEGAKINNETSNLVSVNFWASYTRAPPFNLDLEQERYKIFDIETPIASFISASQYILFNYTTENTTAWPPKPSFTECVMYWCEKEYAPSNFPATSDPTPISRTQQLQIVKQKDVSIWDNATYTFVPPPNSTSLSNKSSAYHISQLPSMVLLNRLVIIFNNTELHENQDSGSAAMQDIMSTNNITDVVKSISTALTDTIRAGDVSSRVPGKAFRTETYIHVRWPWIILPLLVVLASTILLLATTMVTRGAVLWKSSVLPLLMTCLDIAPEYNFSGLRSVSEASRISKKITVTMEHEDDLILSER